uniref:NR LBD domain-containing protein n=1 Tax=Caenorhabditis japonica TaxID=281687 RepID=A0A8R1IX22_CAEJA
MYHAPPEPKHASSCSTVPYQSHSPAKEDAQYEYVPPNSSTASPDVHYAQSYSSSISEEAVSPNLSINCGGPFSLNFEAEQVLEDLLREERLFNERRKLLYCSNSCLSSLLTSENANDIPYSLSDLQPLTFSEIQKHIRPQILLIYEWLRGWRHFDMLNTQDRLIFLRRCVLYHTILDPSYLSY